jgi:ketopantoate hydroxymethyltransferase
MGYESTIPVTMTDMLHHAKCVHRGNQTSFLVGTLRLIGCEHCALSGTRISSD